jgi:hypothetical protein
VNLCGSEKMEKTQMKKLITICVLLSVVSIASAALYVEGFDTGSASWNYGYGSSWTLGTLIFSPVS